MIPFVSFWKGVLMDPWTEEEFDGGILVVECECDTCRHDGRCVVSLMTDTKYCSEMSKSMGECALVDLRQHILDYLAQNFWDMC